LGAGISRLGIERKAYRKQHNPRPLQIVQCFFGGVGAFFRGIGGFLCSEQSLIERRQAMVREFRLFPSRVEQTQGGQGVEEGDSQDSPVRSTWALIPILSGLSLFSGGGLLNYLNWRWLDDDRKCGRGYFGLVGSAVTIRLGSMLACFAAPACGTQKQHPGDSRNYGAKGRQQILFPPTVQASGSLINEQSRNTVPSVGATGTCFCFMGHLFRLRIEEQWIG